MSESRYLDTIEYGGVQDENKAQSLKSESHEYLWLFKSIFYENSAKRDAVYLLLFLYLFIYLF